MNYTFFAFDKSLYNLFDELVTHTTLDGRILHCNKAFLRFVNKKRKEVLGKKDYKLLNLTHDEEKCQKLLKKHHLKFDESTLPKQGRRIFFQTKQRLVKLDSGELTLLSIRQDLTKIKTNFVIYKEYKRLLKQITSGKSLQELLDNLIRSIEKKDSEMLCSVLFLDKSGKRLFTAAAPSLPEFYVKKINGMEVGDKVGSCGAAVSLKRRVIVDDILNHENWQLAKNIAQKANLYACWSQPIYASNGDILGTFAIYYNHPKKPSRFDLQIIKDAASIAGIALEKHKNELQLSIQQEKDKKQKQLLMHKSKQAMMGEMLENIAHQWRQPLSVITTSATGVQLKRELGESSLEYEDEVLENINLNAQYLSQTIEDFRHYFKSSNQFLEFNIKHAYYQTLKLISSRLKSSHVNVIEKIDDVVLMSLENELIQVLMNVFNNSLDELENVLENKRHIRIKIYQDGTDAIIKMIDSAGGVEEEVLNRMFEPYFTTKHQSQGTGIGLYMCKEIVEKHLGGTIEARNSVFKINEKNHSGLEMIIIIPK